MVKKKFEFKASIGRSNNKLNAFKFGLAGGIVSAICIFLTTLGTALFNYTPVYTGIFVDIYGGFGYSATILGAILGAIYGFIDGFIAVGIFAWIYNKLV